jgi:hypothetical protein
MRTVTLVAACAAAIAVGTTAQAQGSAKLRVVDTTPLVVAGSGFQASERVTVTAMTTLGLRIVRLRASTAGTFRAGFRISTRPCTRPFAIRARGAAGSVATVTMRVPPCIPPPID